MATRSRLVVDHMEAADLAGRGDWDSWALATLTDVEKFLLETMQVDRGVEVIGANEFKVFRVGTDGQEGYVGVLRWDGERFDRTQQLAGAGIRRPIKWELPDEGLYISE